MFILHYSSQGVLLILVSISILFFRAVKCVIFTEHFCESQTQKWFNFIFGTRDGPRSYRCLASALALNVSPPPLYETSHHWPHVQEGLIDFPKKLSGRLSKVTESKRDELWILIRQPCPRVHPWATNPGLSKLLSVLGSLNSYWTCSHGWFVLFLETESPVSHVVLKFSMQQKTGSNAS